MTSLRDVAANLVNTSFPVLSVEIQERLAGIVTEEDLKDWAERKAANNNMEQDNE